MKKQNKILIAIIILLLLLGSGFLNFQLYKNLQENKQVLKVTQSSQRVTINKLGQATTTIATLQGDKKTLKSINDSMYNRIRAIERQQRKKLVTATTFDLDTKDTSKGKTIVTQGDTVTKNSIKYVYPVYTSHQVNFLHRKDGQQTDTMSVYDVVANKDSTKVIADVRNPVDLTQRWQKEKIFGRKNLVTDVKTYNHNTSTQNLRSFSEKQPRQYKGVIAIVSIVLGIFLGHGL